MKQPFPYSCLVQRYCSIALFVTVMVGLVGCAGATVVAPPSPPQPTVEESRIGATPLPVTVVPAIASPLPVPAADRGVVTGQVLDLAGQKPVSNTPVYLGQVFRTQDGSGIFTLEPNSSPKSVTDAEGRFTIKDVPPGEYILAVGAIGSIRVPSVLMASPTEVKAFTVQPGEVTDLGAVRVDYLDR